MTDLRTNCKFFSSKVPKQDLTNRESTFLTTMNAMVSIPFIKDSLKITKKIKKNMSPH